MRPVFRSIHNLADRVLCPIENAAAAIAAGLMLVAMVIVTIDTVMRYVFRAPLTFQYYLTENYLLVGMIALGLSWGFRTGGYVRITVLIQHFRETWRNLVLRIGILMSAVYAGLLGWTAWGQFWSAYTTGRVQIAEINWPVAWSWVWIPIGCALLCVRLILTGTGPSIDLHEEHDEHEFIET